MSVRYPRLLFSLVLAGALTGAELGLAQAIPVGVIGQKASVRRPVIWYVDSQAMGPSTGRRWSTAFSSLQDALARALGGDHVWVAAGTYVPAAFGGPQSATFFVPDGVALYGGFNGTETDLAQRDPALNRAILSGDINQDDQWSPSFNIGSVNCWNVVTMQDAGVTTRIDGFAIQAGHLYGAPLDRSVGAGIHLKNSSPTIADCSFSHCVAQAGGAIHSDIGSPTVEGCTFTQNYASTNTARGGAIASDGGVLTVRNSTFSQNLAEGVLGRGFGGAICNRVGETAIHECEFSWNVALPRGGMYGHTVSQGGAVFVESGMVRITSSRFQRNTSNVGGAVSTSFFGTPALELVNSIFVRNAATPIVTSSGNDIGAVGGAIYGSEVSRCDVAGCLVQGGTADNNGGAFVGDLGSVSSSIFWGNSDSRGTIGRSQVRARRVYYSCVMNMLVPEPGEDPIDPAKFPGSIALDPMFTDESLGDFRLQPLSPCIDAADNTAFPVWVTTDFDGLSRFFDDPNAPDTGVGPAPIADMGPHERQ